MNSLSLREAAAKYNVPRATLSGWLDRGLIRVVRGREKRGQALLLLESDIAELAALYKPGRRGGGGISLLQVS
jgi:predicted site-specific integrase-resolvase